MFVLDSDDYTIVADGSDQNAKGQTSDILDNTARSSEDIMADLQDHRRTWIVYDDPDTADEESERIWLVLRLGYVFGSSVVE